MALSAFADKDHSPAEDELRSVLGAAWTAWTQLIAEISAGIPDITPVWAFSGAKTGWGLRLREKERVIVYMTPGRGFFLFSVVLGEKAVVRAKSAGLPAAILGAIEAAPRYAEGRGVRIEVREGAQVGSLAELAALKRETGSRGTRRPGS